MKEVTASHISVVITIIYRFKYENPDGVGFSVWMAKLEDWKEVFLEFFQRLTIASGDFT
jgi:hypothetical protein